MNDFIKRLLNKIEESIDTNTFIDVETSNVELKDLSTGSEWKSLKETVCAFLNTDGGYVICGVRERDKKYKFTGFNRNNEGKIIGLQTKFFQNNLEQFPDLTDTIFFDYLPFKTGEVLILNIKPISEDLKFIKFDGEYYERKLTADYKISESRLKQQLEYKKEIEYAKELTTVDTAEIKDLSLEKINRYVTIINQSGRKETLKASLKIAKSFLEKRYFIKNEKITTLGMLICGEEPFRFLENRCEVDCYFDSNNSIAKDKKFFQNDIPTLMDEAFHFIWRYIRTGRSAEGGGKMITEYPEILIREMLNNALAHRDYKINKFVTVIIEPNLFFQIKNPGSFKESLKLISTDTEVPIRRILSGIPESKNPKLASILKDFDKIESQGRGMAALVNSTLENNIDLPFYDLQDEQTINLTIPSGNLLDEQTERWLSSYEAYLNNKLGGTITKEQKLILAYFQKSEVLNKHRKFTILLSESNNHLAAIEILKQANLISEHSSSTENTPIYIVDRNLIKTDFNVELRTLIGDTFIGFDAVTKLILNVVYRNTQFNDNSIKPSSITPEIYFKEFGKIIEARKYETLGRRVRGICKKLEEENIFIKGLKGAYSLNLNFKTHNLFS